MIGYPFDSQVTFDQYGTPQYDRAVSSKPLKELIKKLFTTGVMPNPSNNLQVIAGISGLTTIVKAGFCIIEGGLKLEEEDKTMMHQAADTTYDRIDTVVMRWNDNDNARICALYVVAGTPSATPIRPTLNREGSVYEIGLADVLIKANSTAISQQRITDTRYEAERCGVISSISEFDTTTIYEQVQADLAGFKANEEADFLEWFDEMKDQLSEDAAGHLQLEIGDLEELETSNKTDLVHAINETTVTEVDASTWEDLPTDGTADGVYLIDDGLGHGLEAANVLFNNTGTGMTATNAQDAISELNADIGDLTTLHGLAKTLYNNVAVAIVGEVSELTGGAAFFNYPLLAKPDSVSVSGVEFPGDVLVTTFDSVSINDEYLKISSSSMFPSRKKQACVVRCTFQYN